MTKSQSNERTYYQILGLEDGANETTLSPGRVKAAYKRALLAHHPDKRDNGQTGTTVTIDEIALAYKVLSEPGLRKEYDRALQLSQSSSRSLKDLNVFHTGLDTVDLDDLEYIDASQVWMRSCRCGNVEGFIVTEPELEKNVKDGELIVGCRGCSLWLRVFFGTND